MATSRVSEVTPAGTVNAFAGATVPSGWLLCDGSAVSRTTYASLFTAIGTTWGVGNGTTTFNIPNLVAKVPRGADGTNLLGSTLGADTHTHTIADHVHSVDPPITTTGAAIGSALAGIGAVSVATAGHTHTEDIAAFNSATAALAPSTTSNIPAAASVNWIVKV